MKLIIGIGNPGGEYVNTRHNAGLLVVDQINQIQNSKLKSQNYNSKLKNFVAKKSDVFMNESGSFVKGALSKYPSIPVSNLYIVHDDLDIPLGIYKIQFGVGPKVHNGVKSIDEALGTDEYWHVRVGVDNRGNPTSREATRGEEYVLQDFCEGERKILDHVIKEVCKKLATF